MQLRIQRKLERKPHKDRYQIALGQLEEKMDHLVNVGFGYVVKLQFLYSVPYYNRKVAFYRKKKERKKEVLQQNLCSKFLSTSKIHCM